VPPARAKRAFNQVTFSGKVMSGEQKLSVSSSPNFLLVVLIFLNALRKLAEQGFLLGLCSMLLGLRQ